MLSTSFLYVWLQRAAKDLGRGAQMSRCGVSTLNPSLLGECLGTAIKAMERRLRIYRAESGTTKISCNFEIWEFCIGYSGDLQQARKLERLFFIFKLQGMPDCEQGWVI